jgi:hypothetical protein
MINDSRKTKPTNLFLPFWVNCPLALVLCHKIDPIRHLAVVIEGHATRLPKVGVYLKVVNFVFFDVSPIDADELVPVEATQMDIVINYTNIYFNKTNNCLHLSGYLT